MSVHELRGAVGTERGREHVAGFIVVVDAHQCRHECVLRQGDVRRVGKSVVHTAQSQPLVGDVGGLKSVFFRRSALHREADHYVEVVFIVVFAFIGQHVFVHPVVPEVIGDRGIYILAVVGTGIAFVGFRIVEFRRSGVV